MPTIDVLGRNVYFSDQGSGPIVLLLHGSLSASGVWRPISGNLGDDHRIIAPDLWGYGKSAPWDEGWEIDVSTECELVETLARSIGEPLHLGGHSHGGVIALAVAMRGNADLKSLISIEATPFDLLQKGGEGAWFAELHAVFDAYFSAIEAGEDAPVRRVIDYWGGAGSYDALQEGVQAFVSAATPMNVINVKTVFAFKPPLEAYRALAIPTLAIHGDKTALSSNAMSRLIAETVPGSQVAAIAGAGHFLISTHAEAVADAIRQWTQRHG